MTDADMQRVAAEGGYSESAFVISRGGSSYQVRFFSPLGEVDFCGHATIATAVALAWRDSPGEVVFDTKAGEIPVVSQEADGEISATLCSVVTRSRPEDPDDLDGVLSALRWSREDVDPSWPAHVAYGGNDHWCWPLRPASDGGPGLRLRRLERTDGAAGRTTVQLFWTQGDTEFHCCNPFPIGGVVEDPATGAATAALGGYLHALDRVPQGRRFVIRQGEDMGRPSLLKIEVERDGQVLVTDQAMAIQA